MSEEKEEKLIFHLISKVLVHGGREAVEKYNSKNHTVEMLNHKRIVDLTWRISGGDEKVSEGCKNIFFSRSTVLEWIHHVIQLSMDTSLERMRPDRKFFSEAFLMITHKHCISWMLRLCNGTWKSRSSRKKHSQWNSSTRRQWKCY